jgi:hypothetical protein
MDEPAADQSADLVGRNIVAGVNRDDARRALGRFRIGDLPYAVSLRRFLSRPS